MLLSGGMGAVLSQLDESGADHPVAYFSRKLLPREERYSTVEKECLVVKLSIQAFRVYLLGKLQTDHRGSTVAGLGKREQCPTYTVEFIPPAVPVRVGIPAWQPEWEC